MTTKRERIYVEMHCTSCKRPHMITREALEDPDVIKKCPHCLSSKIHATGMLGFTATNADVKNAVEQAIQIRHDFDDTETYQAARAAAKHVRIGTVLNPEG